MHFQLKVMTDDGDVLVSEFRARSMDTVLHYVQLFLAGAGFQFYCGDQLEIVPREVDEKSPIVPEAYLGEKL